MNRYTYDPYGQTGEQQLPGAITNPWRSTGEFQDTATGLYKIGARYLDTTLGRWTQQDPLLRAVNPAQPAEANPYAYVGCNPVNYTDPSGVLSASTILGTVGFACTGGGFAIAIAIGLSLVPVGFGITTIAFALGTCGFTYGGTALLASYLGV